ncbi:MAG: rod shape-determining protein [Bacteroidetes bacterium]|nr:rod shape-determining protein [Bacteroidota bacterium]
MGFLDFLATEIGIDLGTANTLFYVRGKGVVLNEPSIVAIDRVSKNVVAIGSEARQMHEKTHSDIVTIRPLKDGVIADFEMTEELIKGFIRKVNTAWFPSIRRMVVCVPSGVTEVEKRAVRDSAEHAGAKEVYLIAEPMAAAIGIGLDVELPVGNMVVDIGGGTTEIAVIALSGIVVDESIRIGGDEMDQAIIQFFRRNHNLLVGEKTAENIKQLIGSATPLEEEQSVTVKGRDLVTGNPKNIEVNSIEVRDSLNEPVESIVSAVRLALEKTPPELAADILDRGIMLTGGGALIRGLDQRIREETGLPVHVADDPLTAVVRGTGRVLEDVDKYKAVLLKARRY